MKMSEQDFELLERHYTTVKLFGLKFYWWKTTPRKVLQHLKQVKQEAHRSYLKPKR